MVVDVVVRHWVTGVITGAEVWGECGKEGRHKAALFYADNGIVASSDPRWLQSSSNTLVVLFDRVGLFTNARNTVDMVFLPCQATGNLSEVAYRGRITGESPTYRERLKGWV